MKRKKVFLFILLFLILLSCLFIYISAKIYPWDKVVGKEVQKKINGTFSLESVAFNLSHITLKNIALISMKGEKVISADTVIVEYHLKNYLKNSEPLECISHVSVINPVINVTCSSEGKWNFQELFKAGEEEIIPFNGSIEIREGKMTLISYKKDRPLNLSMTDIMGKADLWANPSFNFSITGRDGSSCLSLKGEGDYIKSRFSGIAEISDIDISKWGKLVRIKHLNFTGGKINANLSLSLFPQKNGDLFLNMEGDGNIREGSVDCFEGKVQVNNIKGNMRFEGDSLTLLDIQGKREKSFVNISGNISFLQKDPFVEISLDCPDFQVDPVIDKFFPEVEKYKIKGTASIKTLITGPAHKALFLSTITSRSIKVKGKTCKNLYARGSFWEKKLHIQDVTCLFGGGEIFLKGFILLPDEPEEPDMNITMEVKDVNPAYLGLFIPELERFKLNGSVNGKSFILGHKDNPLVSSDVSSSKGLTCMGLNFQGLNTSFTYFNKTLSISNFEGHTSSGSVELVGHIINVKNPVFNVCVDGNNFSLDDLHGIFPELASTGFSGISDFSIEICGSKDDIMARGNFSDASVTTRGQKIEHGSCTFEYADKFFLVSELYAFWNGNPITGKGTVSIGSEKTIDLFLNSSQLKAETIASLYPSLNKYKIKGLLKVDVSARGPWETPLIAGNIEIPDMDIDTYKLKDFKVCGYFKNSDLSIPFIKGNLLNRSSKKSVLPLEGKLTISGISGNMSGNLHLMSQGGLWHGVNLGKIETFGYISKNKIFVNYFNVVEGQGKGKLAGIGYISNDDINFMCWGRNMDLHILDNIKEIPETLQGSLSFTSLVKGSLVKPEIIGNFLVKKGRYGNIKFSLNSDFTLLEKKLLLNNLCLLRKNGMYNMTGEIELKDRYKFTVETEMEGAKISQWNEFASVLKTLAVDGDVRATMFLNGYFDDLKDSNFTNKLDVTGKITIFNGTVKGIAIDVLDTDFALEGGTVNLAHFNVARKHSSLQAKGSYNIKSKELSFNFVSQKFYFKDFQEFFNKYSLKGQGQIRGSLLGTKENLVGLVDFKLLKPEFKGHEVDWASGIINFHGKELVVKSLFVKKNNDVYEGGGHINLLADPELFMVFHAQDVEISDLLKITMIKSLPPLKGKLSFQTYLRGTVSKPVVSSTMKIENMNINSFPVERISAEFHLTQKEINIGHLEVRSGKMFITGYGHMDSGKDTYLTMEGKNIPLDLVEKTFMLGNKFNLEGKMDLNLNASGPTDKLNLIGSFQVIDGMINNYKISRIRSLLSYDGSILNLKDLRFVEKDFNLIASGTVPVTLKRDKLWAWEFPSPMDIVVTTSADDLSILNVFNPDFEGTRGDIKSSLHIGGTPVRPELNGEVSVTNGLVTHKIFREPLDNFKMSLFVNNKNIILDTLEGTMGKGFLKASGTVGLENFIPGAININMEANKILLDLPDYFRSEVTFNSSIKGTLSKPLINGDIKLDDYDAHLYSGLLSFSFDKKSGNIEDTFSLINSDVKVNKEQRPLFGDMGNVKLDLNLKIGNNYWIDSQMFRIRPRGDVRIGGNLSYPTLSGIIDVPQGSINLIGTSFDIRDSQLTFMQDNGFIPVLSVRASTFFQGKEIFVDVLGPANKVSTNFTSNPPMPSNDLMRMLNPEIGYQSNIDNSNIFQNTVLNLTSNTFSGYVFNPIEETLSKGLGLDIFSINLSQNGNVGIEVGKQLNDWLSVSYRLYNRDELNQLNSSTYIVERAVLNLQFKLKQSKFDPKINSPLDPTFNSTFNIGTNTTGDLNTRFLFDYRF